MNDGFLEIQGLCYDVRLEKLFVSIPKMMPFVSWLIARIVSFLPGNGFRELYVSSRGCCYFLFENLISE